MKCIGRKADGAQCKANAQADFMTCARHRDQEPGGVPSIAPEPARSAPAMNREVRFGSIGHNYGITFVISKREQLEVLGYETYKRDRRLRCQMTNGEMIFPAGERSPEEELQIEKLREEIASKPANYKWLCEY